MFHHGNPDLPIRMTKFADFTMVRDDLLPFGFGTKWRKVSGIVRDANKKGIKRILLWGAIHGNYLASFTSILRFSGFFVETIAYTKNPNLKTYNERLVRNHSHRFQCYANRSLALEAFQERSQSFDGLSLPEFGINPSLIVGLSQFWQDLEKRIFLDLGDRKMTNSSQTINAILQMEIGSGVSFLSAYDHFHQSSIQIQAVMVGESKTTWLNKTKELQKHLGLKQLPIREENLMGITSNDTPLPEAIDVLNRNTEKKQTIRFGKQNPMLENWIQGFYKKNQVLLEPIYSAKSVHQILTMGKRSKKENLEPPLYYLHQGGQIQHLDLVLSRQIPS
ncbi:1-aminocyclopropane-1-carboxylate deaminase [Leptospira levettii]|uniref:1-aminocyclopropane-1-carboxylate deaminase n=1 Tax=Leptospira levettii TaxID=2023178 RepID=UPI001EEC7A0F|nr:1-aminocyclopropane-1-carboxylate deaminase [Leptospira levettii]MCG6148908.1 1-aminocyclopropane-1-carboxylate deaminase [Leptospira levettii]